MQACSRAGAASRSHEKVESVRRFDVDDVGRFRIRLSLVSGVNVLIASRGHQPADHADRIGELTSRHHGRIRTGMRAPR